MTRMPRRAALPMAALTAVGVLSPAAHGQAMGHPAVACAEVEDVEALAGEEIRFEVAVGAGADTPLVGVFASLVFEWEGTVIFRVVRAAAFGVADFAVIAEELLVKNAAFRG